MCLVYYTISFLCPLIVNLYTHQMSFPSQPYPVQEQPRSKHVLPFPRVQRHVQFYDVCLEQLDPKAIQIQVRKSDLLESIYWFQGVDYRALDHIRRAMDHQKMLAVVETEIADAHVLADVEQIKAVAKQLVIGDIDARDCAEGEEVRTYMDVTGGDWKINFQSPSTRLVMSTVKTSHLKPLPTDPCVKRLEREGKVQSIDKTQSPAYSRPHEPHPSILYFRPPASTLKTEPDSLQVFRPNKTHPDFRIFPRFQCSTAVQSGVKFQMVSKYDFGYVPFFRLLTPQEKANQYTPLDVTDPKLREALGNAHEFCIQDNHKATALDAAKIHASCPNEVFDLEDLGKKLVVARPEHCSLCNLCVHGDASESLAIEFHTQPPVLQLRHEVSSGAYSADSAFIRSVHWIVSRSYDQWAVDAYITPERRIPLEANQKYADYRDEFDHLPGRPADREVYDQIVALWDKCLLHDTRWQTILYKERQGTYYPPGHQCRTEEEHLFYSL